MVAQNTARTAIRADDCVAADESLVRAFDLLGKRWTGVLLGTLSSGPVGFRALRRAVPGISDSVLSDRLGELTEAGLIARTVAEGPPVSVTYNLTKAGRALLPALEQISRWAERHLPTRSRRELGDAGTAVATAAPPMNSGVMS
jgi:DNA-binding HxlR family transcriptional regulator